MKTLWTKQMEAENLWPPEWRGLLVHRDGNTWFLYYRSPGHLVGAVIGADSLSEPEAIEQSEPLFDRALCREITALFSSHQS